MASARSWGILCHAALFRRQLHQLVVLFVLKLLLLVCVVLRRGYARCAWCCCLPAAPLR